MSSTSKNEPLLRFGKTPLQAETNNQEMEVFKMTLGDETILLVPLRNWSQLDAHKWVPRGKLPGSPPGLEIAQDHVKVAGETVAIQDPEGCEKLEKLFSEWLELEKQTFELARKKTHTKPVVASDEPAASESLPLRYQVEVDKAGQVHIRCTRGKEVQATIGLNPVGFKSLFSQGLMRKPHALQVGALHDWVELEGVLYSFEKGNNDAAKLEKALNDHYVPSAALGGGMDVVIFANPASSTGFDIQFPVMIGGVRDNRRRPLSEESLDLLQDPIKCGLLHKGILIKLTRPMLVFKQKTPDGGERYLESCPENLLSITDEDGKEKVIDLSRPLNYLRLSTVELTAVFNHSAIHKHSKLTPRPAGKPGEQAGPTAPQPISTPSTSPQVAPPPPSTPPAPSPLPAKPPASVPPPPPPVQQADVATAPAELPKSPEKGGPDGAEEAPRPTPGRSETPSSSPAVAPRSYPNAWLRETLAQPPIRHDWLSCLVYEKIAEEVGNSTPGKLGLSNCWAIALDDTKDVSAPEFKGVFLTEKGGFGFLNEGHLARFNKGVAFIGTQEEALEGIGVSLSAAGFDANQRVVFIVSDNYRAKFGVAAKLVEQELKQLQDRGAVILSTKEALESAEPLEVIWTVPAQQDDPQHPQPIESRKPGSNHAEEEPTSTPDG